MTAINPEHSKDRPRKQPEPSHTDEIEKPPVFSTWKGWYILVIANLVALVLIFYWLTRTFS